MRIANDFVFFLGGRDLEMETIRELLDQHAPGQYFDKRLNWGAKTSHYQDEIRQTLEHGKRIVLVELEDDLRMATGPDATRVVVVDHHNSRAGREQPASLQQVFTLLGLPDSKWTRQMELVAANDRGHCRAMLAINANREEMQQIREADRRAQGISADEEQAGRQAAEAARLELDGRLTVVHLPHDRTATVTDALDAMLGGNGFENLLILCPNTTLFFGDGRMVHHLAAQVSGGFWGGAMPVSGFWGHPTALPEAQMLDHLRDLPTLLPVQFPASEIPVFGYRQILIWPLLLKELIPATTEAAEAETADVDGKRRGPMGRQLERWVSALTGQCDAQPAAWFERELLPLHPTAQDQFDQHPPGLSSEPTYEEFVYFHPFVRDFLYGNGLDQSDPIMRCLEREDVRFAQVELEDGRQVELEVPRVELYLCKPLVAMLVVEVVLPGHAGPISLDKTLKLQSQLRQLYPPYFMGPAPEAPGNCPRRVAWLDESRNVLQQSDYLAGRETFARCVHQTAEPPAAAHWQWLLDPLSPLAHTDPHRWSYQQIVDDRIPGMTYLAVDNPRQITDGDFDRLTFCDLGGQAPYPFSETFLAAGRQQHAYDRFWRRMPDHDVPDLELTTRYLCSGYQFVVIGRQGSWFFRNIIPAHFRRHYFRMGLIVHYHRAALLKFADDLAETIRALREIEHDCEFQAPHFRDKVSDLQQTFLKFRSRTWFTEVSNQLQGQELFAWWSRLLKNADLFAQVDAGCQGLHATLAEAESRLLSRTQARLGRWACGLTAIAIIIASLQFYIAFAQPATEAISSPQQPPAAQPSPPPELHSLPSQ